MIFDQDTFKFYELATFKLSNQFIDKLEDSLRDKKELLLTVDASHHGLKNSNGTVYRHDTVQNNIYTFIHPSPKPVIERHDPKKSIKFGTVVGADYKSTKYYDQIKLGTKVDGLSTQEYISMIKDTILPIQKKDPWYNGLGYTQVIAKINNKTGIERIADGEFVNVSIGANPIRLICSECGKNQKEEICEHFAYKSNNTFMLAEELEYEELSFVPRGADPFGRVTKIHDEEQDEPELYLLDILDYNEFYNITKNKTVVCVDKVCTVCDSEDEMPRIKKNAKPEEKILKVEYTSEFSKEKLTEIGLTDEEIDSLTLKDEDAEFAISQTVEDGIKYRFSLKDELSTKVALKLIDSATDLTETEVVTAKAHIDKAVKKFGIQLEDSQTDDATTNENTTEEDVETKTEKTLESLTDELINFLKEVDPTKLEDNDEKPKPVSFIMGAISSLGQSLKWAGEDLKLGVDSYLKQLGQLALEKAAYDSLQDKLTEQDEEIQLLDQTIRDMETAKRRDLVDTIIAGKKSLGKLEDEEAERTKLSKFTYDTLKELSSEYKTLNLQDSFNNKHKLEKVKDPTLLNDGDTGSDTTNTDEKEVKFTETEFRQFFKGLFK